MKNKTLWILFVVAIVLFSTYMFLLMYRVADVQTVDVDIEVGDIIGFNIDYDILNLGMVKPGDGAIRDILIDNDRDRKYRFNVEARGEVKDWITINKEDFYLDSGEKTRVRITANVPRDAEFGEYYGEIVIYTLRY